jgi:SAM-dependent methyltransferase
MAAWGLMSALTPDYDTDPERFLANTKWPHDDVHPYVAARFARGGAHRVLDVGAGYGNLTRLLPAHSMEGLHLDISPAMLSLAPRPAVRADGAHLPLADGAFDAVAALYTLYHFDDPLEPIREARRVLRRGGVFAACAPDRDNDPQLAHVLPNWGAPSTFDGEDAAAIVSAVFDGPDDVVEVEPWDAPVITLATVELVAADLRSHGVTSDDQARDAAPGVDLPLVLHHSGCNVYATKG